MLYLKTHARGFESDCCKWFLIFLMPTSRPELGGYIAASWASLMLQGQEGYLKIARGVMDTCETMKNGVRKIKEVAIIGEPNMTAFAVKSASPTVDIMAVADHMEKLGWKIERLQNPPAMHFR
jgi:sphinganine-1-phosphate aldolase